MQEAAKIVQLASEKIPRQAGGREEICRIVYAQHQRGVFLRNHVDLRDSLVAKWIMGSSLLDHLELPDY